MKQAIILTSVAIVLAVTGSCFSDPVKSNVSTSANSNEASTSNSIHTSENDAASVNSNSPLASNIGDQINKGKKNGNSNSNGPLPPLQFQRVDDDSEIATDMTKDGNLKQIRIFKNDRYIAKAESVWLDATMKELTLYLRSGKTVKVKTDKLGDLKFASVGALLEFAGVTAEEQPERPRVVDKKATVQ